MFGTQAVARRACPIGRVKGEEPRLHFGECRAIFRADEAARERLRRAIRVLDLDQAVALLERELERLDREVERQQNAQRRLDRLDRDLAKAAEIRTADDLVEDD